MLNVVVLAFLFFQLSSLYGQSDTINTYFNESRFSKFNGTWHAYDSISNTFYEIDHQTISIKFNGSSTESQIKIFEVNNQLLFKRKNILGWYDYGLNVSEDSIFNYVQNLQSSSLTNIVEISTKGSFLSTPNDTEHGNQWYPAVIELENAWNLYDLSKGQYFFILRTEKYIYRRKFMVE